MRYCKEMSKKEIIKLRQLLDLEKIMVEPILELYPLGTTLNKIELRIRKILGMRFSKDGFISSLNISHHGTQGKPVVSINESDNTILSRSLIPSGKFKSLYKSWLELLSN